MITDPQSRNLLHSIEAEMAVLGCMLQSPRAVTEVIDDAKLKPEMFYRPAHSMIFEAIQRLVKLDREIDHLTVRVDLQDRGLLKDVGGIDYLFDIEMQAPAISNARYYADIVSDHFLARSLENVGKQIGSIAIDPDIENVDAKIAAAYTLLDSVKSDASVTESTHVQDLAKSFFSIIDESVEGKTIPMIPTGFYALDKRLNGGMRPGGVYGFGGGPKVGKTSFAISILRNISLAERAGGSKYSGMYFSLELSKLDIMSRLVASISGVDTNVTSGLKSPSEREYVRMGDACESLLSTRIQIIDETELTTARISRLVAAQKRTQYGLDYIIVDYYQLVSPAVREKGDTEVSRLTRVSAELRKIAKQHDIAVVLIFQQADVKVKSRDDARPTSTDIHGCTQLGKDCAALAHLYRNPKDESGDPFRGVSTEVIVHLSRYGGDKSVKPFLVYQEAKTRYQNCAEDVPADQGELL